MAWYRSRRAGRCRGRRRAAPAAAQRPPPRRLVAEAEQALAAGHLGYAVVQARKAV